MKDKMKEWKETLEYLDTKHNKESKRRVEEVKKAVSETERLKKKVVKKGSFYFGEIRMVSYFDLVVTGNVKCTLVDLKIVLFLIFFYFHKRMMY